MFVKYKYLNEIDVDKNRCEFLIIFLSLILFEVILRLKSTIMFWRKTGLVQLVQQMFHLLNRASRFHIEYFNHLLQLFFFSYKNTTLYWLFFSWSLTHFDILLNLPESKSESWENIVKNNFKTNPVPKTF